MFSERSVFIVMSPEGMHSPSSSKEIINFMNDTQIKNNSASLHRWVSLCYQRIKQLNTVVGVYLLIEEQACILKAPCLAKKQ